MNTSPDFDRAAAHRFFAAACFNDTWTLLEKADRTADEDQIMLAQDLASLEPTIVS
jgi:hypothetical protein